MANIFIEGFDAYPGGGGVGFDAFSGMPWTVWGNTTYAPKVTTSSPITGTRSLAFFAAGSGGGEKFLFRNIGTPTELFFGFAIRPTGTPNGAFFFRLRGHYTDASFFDCSISFNSSGYPYVQQGGVTRGTAASGLTVGNKSYVEGHFTLSGFEIFVDGTSVLTGTWDTSVKTPQDFFECNVGVFASSISPFYPVIDDIYINDQTTAYNNTNWGETSVIVMVPDANTAQNDWSVTGAASAYEALDNIPPDAAEYISSSTVNDVTIVDLEALPANVFQIFTVQMETRAQKDTSASGEMTSGLVQNGSTTNSGAQVLTEASYKYFEYNVPLDPDTGIAWNPSTFAPQLRYERTA